MNAMKMTKAALAALMAVGMAACGTSGTGDTAATAAASSDAAAGGEAKTLLVGISPDYPPYDTIDTDGNLGGFDVEMGEWLVNWLNENGYNYTLEWSQMSFENLITALNSDQLDLVISGITYAEDRKVEYSEPYYSSAEVVLVAEGSDVTTTADLNGKIVAAQMGSTGEECANEIEGAQVQTFQDAAVAVASLKSGAVDAVVLDKPVADNYVKQGGYAELEEALLDEKNYIIAKEGNTELIDEINEALAAFEDSEDKAQLVEKWFVGDAE